MHTEALVLEIIRIRLFEVKNAATNDERERARVYFVHKKKLFLNNVDSAFFRTRKLNGSVKVREIFVTIEFLQTKRFMGVDTTNRLASKIAVP